MARVSVKQIRAGQTDLLILFTNSVNINRKEFTSEHGLSTWEDPFKLRRFSTLQLYVSVGGIIQWKLGICPMSPEENKKFNTILTKHQSVYWLIDLWIYMSCFVMQNFLHCQLDFASLSNAFTLRVIFP